MFLLALSYLSVRWFSILHTCHFFLCIHFYEGAQIYNNYEVCQTAFHTPGHGLTEKGSSQTDLRGKNRVRHVWEMMYSERCMLDTDVKKVFCSRNGEGWKKMFSCSLSLFFSLEKSGFLQEVHRNLMAVAAQQFAALCLQKLKHIYKNMCQASPTDLQTRHAERGVNHVQEIKIFRATKYGGPITLTYSINAGLLDM